MLFSVPIFTVETYLQDPDSYSFGLTLIQRMGPATQAGKNAFEDTVQLQRALSTPLIVLYVNDGNNTILEWSEKSLNYTSLRQVEKEVVSLDNVPEN